MDTWLIHESSILEKKKFISSKTKIRVGGGERGKKKKKKFISFQSVLKIRLRWFIHTSLSLYRINEVYLD